MVDVAVVEELVRLVLIAPQLADKVDTPITHMRVEEVETLLAEILIFLVVLVKCHTDLVEKVQVDLVFGTKLDRTTTTKIMEQKIPMDNGVRVVRMDTIHRMVLHITIATAVLVA